VTVPIDMMLAGSAVDRASDRTAQAARTEDAGKAAEMFESMLLGELMKAMRATIPESEDGSDFARTTSEGMFDQALADATAGKLGLRTLLERQLGSAGTAPLARDSRKSFIAPATASATTPSSAPRHATGVLGSFADALPRAGEMPVDGTETSGFGFRLHPIHGERRFHEGLDVSAPEGTEIRAVQAGTVVAAGWQGGYGKTVELRHADGSVTRYAHASRIHVQIGDRVDAGEAIADVGQTGSATGAHLHFEAIVDGRAVEPHRYLARVRDQADEAPSARRSGVRTP